MKPLIFLVLWCLSHPSLGEDKSNFLHDHKNMEELRFTTTNSPAAFANALVLMAAYDKMGIGLSFKSVSDNQSLQMANSGRVDGEVKRNASIDPRFANLLKVHVPLYEVEILSLSLHPSHHRTLEEFEHHSICHPYGMDYLANKISAFYRIPVNNFETCFLLVKSHQVDVTFLPRVEGAILNALHQTNMTLSDHVIERYPSFHYLHKKHAKILPKIEKILQVMHDAGDIQLIHREARKFMISQAKRQKTPFCFDHEDSCFSLLNQIASRLSKSYQEM